MSAKTPDLDVLMERLADRYSIGRELGRGGMGAVYLARDLQLDRSVAIKVLPREFAAQHELREGFLRETRTAASFSHPNIVPVFSIEARGDILAMAMGYVEGESVAERVKRLGPLTTKETVRLLQDVGYALSYAHGRGVVHRDIKPDNIMIERATGRALVMDFGISRSIAPVPQTDTGLTRVGEVVGTPEFMSPEQASGDQVDGRSDLYSLGLVAWFAVTGTLAISGETTQKVLVKQLTEVIPPVASARADLPSPLANAIDRLLRKDPNERFATAEALVEAIDAAQLAAPVVPLPVRSFEQEGRSYVSNALLILLFIVVTFNRSKDQADLDRIMGWSVGFALEMVLLISIARQARMLRDMGFDHAALRNGLRAILAEGNEARAQGLAMPGVARKRRVRLIMAPVLAVISAMNLWMAVASRVEYAPGLYRSSRAGAIQAISGVCAFFVALLLLVLDPFRTPLMQRLSNAFWGGPIGAVLMGSAPAVTARGDVKALADARKQLGAKHPAPPAVGASSAGSVGKRLDSIEARLSALERTRAKS